MAVQFSGSRSTGDRRRRRLVVNGDSADVRASLIEADGAEMESKLVASEAAGPWVPHSEMRIWIYAALIGLGLGLVTFAHSRPTVFHTAVAPISDHLLAGPRPVLIVGAQSLFLAFAAQLASLISWYRSRCRLDFGGRYRIWPWASGLLVITAFCIATDVHRTFGDVVHRNQLLTSWRATTIAWLMPFGIASLIIARGIDRDLRNSRSSLITFRISAVLVLAGVALELFQPELQSQSSYYLTFLLTPLFACATLFLSFWLHARVVAYVCPDPPEIIERSAVARLLELMGWIGSRLMFWKRTGIQSAEDAKPKRRRKAAETTEVASKRKRKTPAKRTTTRTKARTKLTEEEQVDESANAGADSYDAETDGADSYGAEGHGYSETEPTHESVEDSSSAGESWEQNPEDSEQEEYESPPPKTQSNAKKSGRMTYVDESHSTSAPAPNFRRVSASRNEEPPVEEEVVNSSNEAHESNEESDEDRQFQLESGMTADQMKGLSKRQKRELKRQMREQERGRGR